MVAAGWCKLTIQHLHQLSDGIVKLDDNVFRIRKRVVYSGSGLLGLGMLIIVKHDENYLSAYGHNKKLLVKEGKRVRAGQKIAEMGKTGTDRVKLHFEIRYKGKPVDPKRFLPRHRSR